MSNYWFTEPGESGSVMVDWFDGGWYVTSPDTNGEVKCIAKGTELSKESGPHRIEGTVSRYMIGTGGDANYLHLDTDAEMDELRNLSLKPSRSTATTSDDSDEQIDTTNLAELSGSGDYVTVEAVVDSVFWINKDEPNSLDVKGKLIDDSVRKGVVFVVEGGVKHPYLEEGRRFRFSNVKDYYYKKNGEVQVKISHRTNFTDLGKSKSSSNSTQSKSSDRASLHAIAANKISNKEFTVTQEDRESAVGKAKERARKQGRDPAIDPHFQNDEDDSNAE